MRPLVLPVTLLAFLVPSLAVAAAIPCSDLPMAESFVQKLRPGPNTRAAERHLEAAKAATSDAQCSAELREVDRYARRSVAADKQRGHRNPASARVPHS